jgi:hypothetical protein
MSYSGMKMVRMMALLILGAAAAACGDSGSSGGAAPRSLTYCDNPEAAPLSCTLSGYSTSDDSALRAKLEGCAVGGCHAASGGFTTWGIDLSGGVESALSALNIPAGTSGFYLFDDQDPDCSLLLSELSDVPVGAVRMPVTGNYWSAAEVDCLRSYLHEIGN